MRKAGQPRLPRIAKESERGVDAREVRQRRTPKLESPVSMPVEGVDASDCGNPAMSSESTEHQARPTTEAEASAGAVGVPEDEEKSGTPTKKQGEGDKLVASKAAEIARNAMLASPRHRDGAYGDGGGMLSGVKDTDDANSTCHAVSQEIVSSEQQGACDIVQDDGLRGESVEAGDIEVDEAAPSLEPFRGVVEVTAE